MSASRLPASSHSGASPSEPGIEAPLAAPTETEVPGAFLALLVWIAGFLFLFAQVVFDLLNSLWWWIRS